MRTLLLVTVLGMGALLLVPAAAQAQNPFPFSSVYYGYGAGGPYVEARNYTFYPASGFSYGIVRSYSPVYGYYAGFYTGVPTPLFGTASPYQFFPATYRFYPVFVSRGFYGTTYWPWYYSPRYYGIGYYR